MKTRILALVVMTAGCIQIGCSSNGNQTSAAAAQPPPCSVGAATTAAGNTSLAPGAAVSPCGASVAAGQVVATAVQNGTPIPPQVAPPNTQPQVSQVPGPGLLPASTLKGPVEKTADMESASVDSGSAGSYERGGLLTIPGYVSSEREFGREPSSIESVAPQESSGSDEAPTGGIIK